VVAKNPAAIPVANKSPAAPTVDVQDYYIAHKQLPSYQPVNNRTTPAAAAR
jgi:hypothetical protein